MKRPRRTLVHLPPLEPDEALHFARILEGIIEALWKAHGEDMSLRGIDRTLAHPRYADPKLPQPRFHLIPDDEDPPF